MLLVLLHPKTEEYTLKIFLIMRGGGIHFEFFDAITPSTLDKTYAVMPSLAYNKKLSWTEKACLMSHALLWQKCINENIPHMGIFEDDVVLGKNAHLFLQNSNWIEERFGDSAVIIRLETSLQRANLKNNSVKPLQHLKFMELENPLMGAAAYIISKAASKILIENLKNISIENANEAKAADWVVFDNMLNREDVKVYQILPAVCIQDHLLTENNSLGSLLEAERSQYHKNNRFPKKRKTLGEWISYILTTPQRKYKKFKRVYVPFEK